MCYFWWSVSDCAEVRGLLLGLLRCSVDAQFSEVTLLFTAEVTDKSSIMLRQERLGQMLLKSSAGLMQGRAVLVRRCGFGGGHIMKGPEGHVCVGI